MSANISSGIRDEWRRHWCSVAGAGTCVAAGYGVYPFVASQFVQPLHARFDWSRSAQSLSQNAAFAAAFLAPLVGRATDRYGVRPTGLLCLSALGIIYALLAAMRRPIAIYYSLTGAAVFFRLGTTGVVFMRAVSTHFTRSLGLALAVSRSGVAISAALLPVLIYQSIRSFGWRGGYVLLAAVTLLIGLPACVVWVSEEPSVPSQ